MCYTSQTLIVDRGMGCLFRWGERYLVPWMWVVVWEAMNLASFALYFKIVICHQAYYCLLCLSFKLESIESTMSTTGTICMSYVILRTVVRYTMWYAATGS
jgi:hypothetical protein